MCGPDVSMYFSSISYCGQKSKNLILVLEVIQFLTKLFSSVLPLLPPLMWRAWGLNALYLGLGHEFGLGWTVLPFPKYDRSIPASEALLIALLIAQMLTLIFFMPVQILPAL